MIYAQCWSAYAYHDTVAPAAGSEDWQKLSSPVVAQVTQP